MQIYLYIYEENKTLYCTVLNYISSVEYWYFKRYSIVNNKQGNKRCQRLNRSMAYMYTVVVALHGGEITRDDTITERVGRSVKLDRKTR